MYVYMYVYVCVWVCRNPDNGKQSTNHSQCLWERYLNGGVTQKSIGGVTNRRYNLWGWLFREKLADSLRNSNVKLGKLHRREQSG